VPLIRVADAREQRADLLARRCVTHGRL
jgi:hypothetical protein